MSNVQTQILGLPVMEVLFSVKIIVYIPDKKEMHTITKKERKTTTNNNNKFSILFILIFSVSIKQCIL